MTLKTLFVSALLIITGLYNTKTIAKNTLIGAKTSEFYNILHDADNYHEAMKKMMEKMKAVQLTGNIDYDFALLMIEHHKGAIDMSKIELKDGRDAKISRCSLRSQHPLATFRPCKCRQHVTIGKVGWP